MTKLIYEKIDQPKYRLLEPYTYKLGKSIGEAHTEFIDLEADGTLTLKHGFLTDGPSGPTLDSEDFMRGAFIHDALYGLIKQGFIDFKHRAFADKVLIDICKEDGMSGFRRWYVYLGVRIFGASHAKEPEEENKDNSAYSGGI